MSVVIGIKYDKGVVIGADKITVAGCTKNDTATKIVRTKYSNHCIGSCGELRDGNVILVTDELMNYKDILDGINVDFNYVVNTIVPNLFNNLRSRNRMKINDNIEYSNSEYIYCTSEKIFQIDYDGAVLEHKKYCVRGVGEENVMGYINSIDITEISKSEAIDIVKNAIKKACKDNLYINDEVDLIVLERR